MKNNLQVVHQSSLLDYFKPDVELDDNILIIGAREHNLHLFESFISEFSKCKIFALDTETFGAESWHPLYFRYNKIRLLQIGLESGLVLIIDFGGWKEEADWENIRANEQVRKIISLLAEKCFDKSVAVLGVNLKFDGTTLLEHFSIKLRQCRDLMIISQVLWAGLGVEKAGKGEARSERCKISHGLAGIAERLGFEVDKTEQKSAWGWPLSNSQINYAAKDVRILFPLFNEMRNQVLSFGLQYSAWVESNAVSAFIDMEFYGVPISKNKCKEIIARLQEEHDSHIKVFEETFPGVSHTSQPQVLQALRTIYPDLEAVNKEVLYKLEHPVAKALIRARAIKTDIDYVTDVLNYSFRGSIRSTYRQIAASGNGRSSCAKDISVNRKKYRIGTQLQNPSKKIRDIFEAPPGYVFFDFDGAQMHARIATECSGSAVLQKIFNEDYDGHSILAGRIAELAQKYWKSLPPEELTEDIRTLLSVNWNQDLIFDIKAKQEWTKSLDNLIKTTAIAFRDVSKTTLYSLLNGATAGRLLLAMHNAGYKWFTIENAKDTLDYFYKVYPELKVYIDKALKQASLESHNFSHFKDFNGQPIDSNWGRTQVLSGRHLYLKKYPNKFNPNKLEVSMTDCTAAQWTPVEKNLMSHWAVEVLWEADLHPEWDFHMCNLPHDQGTFLGKEEYAEQIAPVVVGKFVEVCSQWIKSIPMVEQHDIDNPMSCVKKVLTK
jgi:DNA polymerase I-like protein with 3'-5' exonuclease and polymerase domains